MVDSDPGALPAADAVAAAPEAPTTATTALPVLAKGHLHPAILLLRLFDALQRAVFPVVAGLVLPGYRWLLAVGAVLFVLQLGYALARYLTLEYTLTAAELRIREGLLERQERRIPLDRIQDLGFESTLLRRFLGLAVVLVETASGRGVEARLDALGRADAEHLREVLLAARAAAVAAPAVGATDEIAAPAAPEPEWLVHRSTTGELLLRGLTDLRLSAFVLTGFAALRASSEFDFVFRLAGVGQSLRGWIGQFPPLMIGLILLGLLAIVVLFGVLATMIGNLVQFHGFALTLRGDVLQRRFGLLTTRQKTLPRPRIQRVTYEQPWLRRLLGVGVVKADSARAAAATTEGAGDAASAVAIDPRRSVRRAQRLLALGRTHGHPGPAARSTRRRRLVAVVRPDRPVFLGLDSLALSLFGDLLLPVSDEARSIPTIFEHCGDHGLRVGARSHPLDQASSTDHYCEWPEGTELRGHQRLQSRAIRVGCQRRAKTCSTTARPMAMRAAGMRSPLAAAHPSPPRHRGRGRAPALAAATVPPCRRCMAGTRWPRNRPGSPDQCAVDAANHPALLDHR
jgi:membrane protein YdbS with pleckstrin-like domain